MISGKRPREKAGASMNSAKRITVLVVDDNPDLRDVLRLVLEGESDIEVVGEAGNGREAVAMALTLHPDVVVMDVAMPVLDGLEATRQIREADHKVKVVILSAHGDDAYIERATVVGAAGFLIKHTSVHLLAEVIREVHKGNRHLIPVSEETTGPRGQKSRSGKRLATAK